jgi:CBS domain-containing protein
MKPTKLRKLPVRARHTLHGDGESTSVRTVLCPTHGHAIGLATCAECAQCERIDLDERGRGVVECRPEAPKPTMRWTPMVRRILPSAADRVAIAEVMTRDVTCVTGDVSVEAITAMFLERGYGAAPVVDDEGFPVGVISKTDLVRERWENDDTGVAESPAEVVDGMHVARVPRAVVNDVMTPLAFTLCEDDPLSRAAAVMAVEGVHHLPVVSADGRVVGMLSSLDFVRWVAAQSAYADQA